MNLFDDASKEETVEAMKIYSAMIIDRATEILHQESLTSHQVEDLGTCLELLLSTHGHLCRLWAVPYRQPLVDMGGQGNRSVRWTLRALNKLSDLSDVVEFAPADVTAELVEDVVMAACQVLEVAHSLP